MIRTSLRVRALHTSHRRPAAALAAALAIAGMGLGGAAMFDSPAMAAPIPAPVKPNYSKPFIAAAGPLQTALAAAKGKTLDAPATAALQAQVDAVFAAATTPDDHMLSGQFAVQLGGMTKDVALQRRGVQAMIDSGKAGPENTARLYFFLGQFQFQANEYAAARTSLQTSIAGGYHENDPNATLAEVDFLDGHSADGLAALQAAIDARRAGGVVVPEGWYGRGLGVAYKAKLPDLAASYAAQLVQYYPSSKNWAGAIDTLRLIAHYPLSEELDLMRLMARTNSYTEERDYAEYIEIADARRFPAEVKGVIDAGVASGKLSLSNTYIGEANATAIKRLPSDRASLPSLERDASLSSASAIITTGAADAFLSYGESAKAIALYGLALPKAGANQPLIYTRLGIAQSDMGDYAGAQASFAKVTGARAPLARLWSIYTAQKAAPAPASAPAK